MKTIGFAIIIFTILIAFACNNQKNKNLGVTASIADKAISNKKINDNSAKTEKKELTSCEYLVREILTTSPRYRQLTKGLYKAILKNGGLSFGISLDGSPNPTQDKSLMYSKTYDFTLYEMYPDRQLNTARFSYDPKKKQLYEYDIIADQLMPIAFDKNLLLNNENVCK